MVKKRIISVKPVKPKIKSVKKIAPKEPEDKPAKPAEKPAIIDGFRQLLKEVKKYYKIDEIAINLLVTPVKVESWLKGKDLPNRSTIPVLNNVLKYLLNNCKAKK